MNLTISTDNTGAIQEEDIMEAARRCQVGAGGSKGFPVSISGAADLKAGRLVNTREASVEPPEPHCQGQCLEDLEGARIKTLYGEEGAPQALMPRVQVSPPMDITTNPHRPETRS